MSYYQPSENNQDRRGNLKKRQGNYMLKCLFSEPMFHITTASFHVSDQEVISSKPLVQKVILDTTLMAGQWKYFPSNGIQSIGWRSDSLHWFFGICFHHSLKHPYETQLLSSTKCIRRGDSWSLGISWWSSIHNKVNCAMMSSQLSIGSYNMCQTGMGASLCLLIHLMASWPEYLSYCKCWPVSLNLLKDDDECALSAPLWYEGAHGKCIGVCCFKGVFSWGWGKGWSSQTSLIQT